ncbi:MAG: hypothetical protein IKQ91_09455 [Oscillospiraceae bacterium]|nr:hypothetical protein [Oscillospiraceae bacterium]
MSSRRRKKKSNPAQAAVVAESSSTPVKDITENSEAEAETAAEEDKNTAAAEQEAADMNVQTAEPSETAPEETAEAAQDSAEPESGQAAEEAAETDAAEPDETPGEPEKDAAPVQPIRNQVVRVATPVRLRGTANSRRSVRPEQTVKPGDIKKPQVSFMNSIAHVEAESLAQREHQAASTAQAYDHAVIVSDTDENGDYRPKIRRMNDSTRAKELRRRQSSDRMPYQRVSPGAAPQTLPAAKLRKRRMQQPAGEALARIPENLKQHPVEAGKPVRYIRQAEHTQINLSANNREARRNINIDVRFQNEQRERTDLPMEAKTLSREESRKSILNDLLELSTNLSMRIAILGFLAICSGLLTFFDWLPGFALPAFLSSSEAPVAFLTIQLLLGLAAMPFCAPLLKNGYTKLLKLQADCDSLAAMSMISAEIAAFLILPSPGMLRAGTVSVYISVGLLSLTLNAAGKKLITTRALRNFERLTDGNPKYGIHYVEDEKRAESLTRGTNGDFPIVAAMQPVGTPEDFLKYTFSTDIADKFCRTAVPLMTVISALFAGGMAFLRRGSVDSAVCYGMSIFALCFAACACTAITLISNLPMASGTKDYVRNSGILLGYQSVDDFYDINTVMVDALSLFPQGSTKLESIQVIGEGQIADALQYAASLTQHAGSILKDLFAGAILTEEKMLLPVENYVYDEAKGISGWIRNKRILLGTRDMMIEHSVEGIPVTAKVREMMPEGTEALYLSVAGSVSALFIIRLEAAKSVRHWLKEVEKENLLLLVRSSDAMLSQRRISKMFGIREDHVKILPARCEMEYNEETAPLEKAKPSMLCAGRLAGFVQTVVGAKRIRSAATLGLIIQAATALVGLLFVLVFIALGAYSYICGGLLLIFHLICTAVTVISIRMKDT